MSGMQSIEDLFRASPCAGAAECREPFFRGARAALGEMLRAILDEEEGIAGWMQRQLGQMDVLIGESADGQVKALD